MPADSIILFLAIPLAAGLICVALAKQLYLARTVGTLSLVSLTLLSLVTLIEAYVNGRVLVSQMGHWPAPFGISIVFDCLSGLLLCASSLVALGAYIHSFSLLRPEIERRYFHPLLQFLMFGVNMSFLTGDLFNLFVSFEVMLLASYVLLTLGGSRKQLTQAYKYVLLNLLASTVFVMSAGMVYGMFGTLNIADLSRIVHELQAQGRPMPTGFTALGVLLLLVFALKGAFFPLWFWLPDTYHTCPISIAGLFGGVLTKVGVYAVARTFPLIFAVGDTAQSVLLPILAVSAVFTMFLGVLGAVSQHEMRRLLAIHVISQVGYMIFGIAVMTGWALAGVVFHIIHNMVVKAALFLCCGCIERHTGTDDLDKLGGLLRRDVLLAILLFVAAMSLVGLPPLSGFFSKLVIIREGWAEGHITLAIFGLLTGALTLLSMLKIWSYGFWSPTPERYPARREPAVARRSMRSAYAGVILLVVAALFLGFGAQPVYKVALRAGEQLADPVPYISAVLVLDADDLRARLEPRKNEADTRVAVAEHVR